MKRIFLEGLLATHQVDTWARNNGARIVRAIPKVLEKPMGYVVYYM